MTNLKKVVGVIGVTMLSTCGMPVFAESAPVYDADAMSAQIEASGDNDVAQPDRLPPSVSPDGGFAQQQRQAAVAANQNAAATSNLDSRLKKMEKQLENMQGSESSAKVEALQSEIQSLRGQVEQLTHQLQQAQEQQKTTYADLDKRLRDTASSSKKAKVASNDEVSANDDAPGTTVTKSERKAVAQKPTASKSSGDDEEASDEVANGATVAAGADTSVPTTAVASSTTAEKASKTAVSDSTSKASTEKTPEVVADASKLADDQPNVAEEQQIYQTAYTMIKAKKYDDAVNVLQGMLRKYPSGQFASNAHYWLGELFGLQGKNDLALAEFNTVVKSYPTSPRVSDAQLKVGVILAVQSKWPDAKQALKAVINRYPGTSSARLASEQLKQIKLAGH